MGQRDLDLLIDGIEAPPWLENFRSYVFRALSAAKAADWDLSVTLTGDSTIRELNRKWRGKDEATDVLSFESDPETDPQLPQRPPRGMGCYGDLVVSMDTLATNSAYFGVELSEELQRVTLHGILHLMGWDHATNEGSEPMLLHQEGLLAGIKERLF